MYLLAASSSPAPSVPPTALEPLRSMLSSVRLLLERPEALDNLIQANVGVELGLDVREDHNRAVGSTTTASRLLDEVMY